MTRVLKLLDYGTKNSESSASAVRYKSRSKQSTAQWKMTFHPENRLRVKFYWMLDKKWCLFVCLYVSGWVCLCVCLSMRVGVCVCFGVHNEQLSTWHTNVHTSTNILLSQETNDICKFYYAIFLICSEQVSNRTNVCYVSIQQNSLSIVF